MVDIKSRLKLAELIRYVVAGLITVDEFEDAIPVSEDKAVDGIYYIGAWHLYSDWTDRLIGKNKVSKDNKNIIARWILFLKTPQEYSYPEQRPIDALLGIVTLGFWMKKVEKRFIQTGDTDYWPFRNKNIFEEAKRCRGYLGYNNGKRL